MVNVREVALAIKVKVKRLHTGGYELEFSGSFLVLHWRLSRVIGNK